VPYCYYKLVTNVIKRVKRNVLSYPWYTAFSIQSLNNPVYNCSYLSGKSLKSLCVHTMCVGDKDKYNSAYGHICLVLAGQPVVSQNLNNQHKVVASEDIHSRLLWRAPTRHVFNRSVQTSNSCLQRWPAGWHSMGISSYRQGSGHIRTALQYNKTLLSAILSSFSKGIL
jgi:hypothetical protein